MASVQAVTRETAVSADRSGVVTWSASPTPTSSVASKGNRKHSLCTYVCMYCVCMTCGLCVCVRAVCVGVLCVCVCVVCVCVCVVCVCVCVLCACCVCVCCACVCCVCVVCCVHVLCVCCVCVCVCTVYIAAYVESVQHTWSVMYSDYLCVCAIQCCTGRNGRGSVISQHLVQIAH